MMTLKVKLAYIYLGLLAVSAVASTIASIIIIPDVGVFCFYMIIIGGSIFAFVWSVDKIQDYKHNQKMDRLIKDYPSLSEEYERRKRKV